MASPDSLQRLGIEFGWPKAGNGVGSSPTGFSFGGSDPFDVTYLTQVWQVQLKNSKELRGIILGRYFILGIIASILHGIPGGHMFRGIKLILEIPA